MKKKKRGGISSIKRRYGYIFVSPWIFGVIVFVLVPLLNCIYYSFSDTSMQPDGLKTTFVGLSYYKELFTKDPYYINDMAKSMSSIFTSMPLVIALSMILAIVLNQEFKGRTLVRGIFFLPVIIVSGPVMKLLDGFSMTEGLAAMGGSTDAAQSSEFMQLIDFSQILQQLSLPQNINNLIEGYLRNTFNLIWSCGVQILLFVAGLQTIPKQLYEAGTVEGITAWEQFWYITVPMLGRIIMLVMFYTMVEMFITDSPVIERAESLLTQDMKYSASSAMLWPYFILVGIAMGLIIFVYNRLCLKKWE